MTAPAPALLLARSDIAALMGQDDWLEAAETAFRANSEHHDPAPLPMAVAACGGAFHAKAAMIRLERPYVALKLNCNFPDNPSLRGLPTIQGTVLLCCGETGALLAIMDSIEVTLRRTAAATALAARLLARRGSHALLLCGCGDQATAQLPALRHVLPLRKLCVWDRDGRRARAFAAQATDRDLAACAVEDLAEAAPTSDIIVTCTTSTEAFLKAGHVRPGTFIAAVGADSPSKSEIDPHLVAAARIVTDCTDQCAIMGDLHHALAAGMVTIASVDSELGELVRSDRPIAADKDRVTLFDSTGIAMQDAAAAALIFRRAIARGVGQRIGPEA